MLDAQSLQSPIADGHFSFGAGARVPENVSFGIIRRSAALSPCAVLFSSTIRRSFQGLSSPAKYQVAAWPGHGLPAKGLISAQIIRRFGSPVHLAEQTMSTFQLGNGASWMWAGTPRFVVYYLTVDDTNASIFQEQKGSY